MVILGEVHDNPAHHRAQAEAVAAIRPAALVFEMLTPAQAAAAQGVDRTDAAALRAALGWDGTGWPDFALYAPIFAAAPEARLYGAALPIEEVRRAMREGAAAVFGPEAQSYGLDAPLPAEEQAAREAEQQEDHCNALPEAMLPGMVAAQRLRDAAFARTTLIALHETGGPVVVITGSGHARTDRGIPDALRHAAPVLRVLSIGQIEGAGPPEAPFDLWLAAPPAPRGDVCAAFRKP